MNGGNLKNLFTFLMILLALFIYSCDSSTKPEDEEPQIVPQVDIEWSSLANTPWPMHHHDPQSTGRSKYAGPQQGIISKRVYVGLSVTGISIGYNSTIFIATSYPPFDFFAMDYEGNTKWVYSYVRGYTTPLISRDSTIYVSGSEYLLSFNHEGDTLWRKQIEKSTCVGMNIDLDGNIYFINYFNTLIVVDKNGDFRWKLEDDRLLGGPNAAPTFSPDSKILYLQGQDVSVLALNIESKSIEWTFGDQPLQSSPVVDNAGNLYILPGEDVIYDKTSFYSLNPTGQIIWEFEFSTQRLFDNIEPTIDYNGNLYFGTDTLYSLTNSGKLRWKKYLNGYISSPLISDINNVVYVAANNLDYGTNYIIAFDEAGSELWKIEDNEERLPGVSAAINENGTLFYPTWNNDMGNYLIIN